MNTEVKFTRIPTLKTVADFRRLVAALGLDLPCEDDIATRNKSPLAQPLTEVTVNGKTLGNRYADQPIREKLVKELTAA